MKYRQENCKKLTDLKKNLEGICTQFFCKYMSSHSKCKEPKLEITEHVIGVFI